MTQRSHIQVPKAILKQFADPLDKKVWYLDIQSGEIKKASPKTLGTLQGYYSCDMESYLNSRIETPVMRVNRRISDFCNHQDLPLNITVDEQLMLRQYIKNLMARSDLAYRSFLASSIFAPLYSEQSNHDGLVHHSTETYGEVDKMLLNSTLRILVNKTERKLVIPRNGFYSIKMSGIEGIVVPVCPNGGTVLLFPNNRPIKVIDPSFHYLIDSVENLEQLNIMALSGEYQYNRDFVASISRPELDLLQVYLAENRTRLEQKGYLW